MLCEECKERPVTVFITQIVDSAETKLSLCAACAEPFTAGLTPTPAALGDHTAAIDPTLMQRPPNCPTEVTITDPVTILELSRALQASPFQVIVVLIQHEIFKSIDDTLDFATASLVCAHYDVTPRKA